MLSVIYSGNYRVLSGEGAFGEWQSDKFCSPGKAIIGFALRSEQYQDEGDNIAADNFVAYCGYPFGPRAPNTWIQGETISSNNNEYIL